MPTPMLDMSVGSLGVDPMASMATVDLQHEIDSAIGHPVAEALLGEIKRCNLGV
jgi:hypothetical protein